MFSITIVVLQLTSSQFSPWVLRTFLRDRTIQWSLGVFVATFVYAIMVDRDVLGTTERNGFVPRVAVSVALAFVLLSVALFIRYVDHVANMIRVASIIAVIGEESRQVLQRRCPMRQSPYPAARLKLGGEPLGSPGVGVLVSVNEEALVRHADIAPHPQRIIRDDPTNWPLPRAVGYVLSIPTNRLLIISSVLGYFFFSGLQTFAVIGLDHTLLIMLLPLTVAGLTLLLIARRTYPRDVATAVASESESAVGGLVLAEDFGAPVPGEPSWWPPRSTPAPGGSTSSPSRSSLSSAPSSGTTSATPSATSAAVVWYCASDTVSKAVVRRCASPVAHPTAQRCGQYPAGQHQRRGLPPRRHALTYGPRPHRWSATTTREPAARQDQPSDGERPRAQRVNQPGAPTCPIHGRQPHHRGGMQ